MLENLIEEALELEPLEDFLERFDILPSDVVIYLIMGGQIDEEEVKNYLRYSEYDSEGFEDE